MKRSAARIIRAHYGLKRAVTDKEVAAEIESLNRKEGAGGLCDFALSLWGQLRAGGYVRSSYDKG